VGANIGAAEMQGGARGRVDTQFPCFDGLRALAALMVIVYHAVLFGSAPFFRTAGGSYLGTLNTGVWIFFTVSGFLLYRPFAASHVAGGRGVELRGYAIRRFARIYPAYWVVLAFFTFVVHRAQIRGVDGFFVNTTLTKTYVHEENPFLIGLPPAWSLVIELTFYAFLPFYAALIAFLARKWKPLPVEFTGIAVACAISLASIVAIANGLDAPWVAVLPQHLAPFALGMLLAVISTYHWSDEAAERLARIGRPAWVWWLLAAAAFVAIPLVFRHETFSSLDTGQAIGIDILQILLGFFVVVPAVFGPQDHGIIRRGLRARPVVYLGLVSYGLYLWHWFLYGVVREWLDWEPNRGNWVTLVVLTFPLVLFAATASWFLVERPILTRVHRIGRARTPVRAPR
jgi:peptidoglycan/LPS O-acetylase OafA/YrhL